MSKREKSSRRSCALDRQEGEVAVLLNDVGGRRLLALETVGLRQGRAARRRRSSRVTTGRPFLPRSATSASATGVPLATETRTRRACRRRASFTRKPRSVTSTMRRRLDAAMRLLLAGSQPRDAELEEAARRRRRARQGAEVDDLVLRLARRRPARAAGPRGRSARGCRRRSRASKPGCWNVPARLRGQVRERCRAAGAPARSRRRAGCAPGPRASGRRRAPAASPRAGSRRSAATARPAASRRERLHQRVVAERRRAASRCGR